MEAEVVKTDLLIVGAGPAGAALACFLASHGRTGIMIATAPGTAETPRAHITNMAAMECLRDIGLDGECMAVASPGHHMEHTRWCHSMAGEEFARIHSWGHDPARKGEYISASPCEHVDLPQTELEPILVKRAVHAGWTSRFNTSFLGFTRNSPGEIISDIRDELTNQTYKIHSRFLFGCDGARSQVIRQLNIPLVKKPGQGLALNVLVKADLSHLVKNRTGNLHWIIQPDKENPPWGWSVVLRMVKPWTEWMFIFLPQPGVDVNSEHISRISHEDYLAQIRQVIGDESVRVEIVNISRWWINETVAEYYSDGNIFCLGDAVHRHPPSNGLGSNTCIQDAFNLAWKVAYIMSGKADAKLLDSFTAERQPVGVEVVTRANQGLRDHGKWTEAIGMTEADLRKRCAILAEFDDPGDTGRRRRQLFQEGIADTATEYHGLGAEMNQRYFSNAVYQADEEGPAPVPEDATRVYQITTFPGRRLPHAWINTRLPGKPISTIDLAGHGCFCIITGPGGQAWKNACKTVSEKLGVPIRGHSIGWKQDYEDVYFDWARRREIRDDGCVLVRPDRFIAWRSTTAIEDCTMKLEAIMRAVLSLDTV